MGSSHHRRPIRHKEGFIATTVEHWPWGHAPVCLITGSSRGLGLAVGEALARRGATVLLSARDHADATAAADRSAAGLHGLHADLDVADPHAVDAAAATVKNLFGRLDVLINNAAAYVDWSETATTVDLARSRQVMDTNLYGAWTVTQCFLPLLRPSAHPRIVNVASGAGSHGDPHYGLAARNGSAASYGISKAALLATLAAELAATPVIINAVDPTLTATWPGAGAMGARPVNDSVPGILWAATLPDYGPRGGFFRDSQPHPW